MKIHYITGDLFKIKRTNNTYLLHACNCKGVWGSGIAATFKMKYPKDFTEYHEHCVNDGTEPGSTLITSSRIICLMTSRGYNTTLSSKEVILENTKSCLDELKKLPKASVIYSNKFNSGLFRVPWEQTEKLVLNFLKSRPDVTWTVVEWDK